MMYNLATISVIAGISIAVFIFLGMIKEKEEFTVERVILILTNSLLTITAIYIGCVSLYYSLYGVIFTGASEDIR
jgi:hypothetical protein